MTIAITTSGIALDGPLVAGEKVAVSVSGLSLAAEDKPTLALLARFPDALLASVELAEDAQTPETWTGELDTATKQTALFFATARADERRDAALELVSGRVSLARLTVPMANSALCPKPDGSPFASPVYIPVPGPPGTGGDPYDQNPEMDGEASPGTVDEYARGDHRHPTDTTRASTTALSEGLAAKQDTIADLAAIRSGASAGATAVQPAALSAYRTATVQDAIDGAQDTAIAAKYTKPATGIPASDLAAGVIPTVPTLPLSIANGGTGAASKNAALANLGAVKKSGDTMTGPLQVNIGGVGVEMTQQGVAVYAGLVVAPTVYGDGRITLNNGNLVDLPTAAGTLALQSGIAPAFSASSTYAVGDYVTHEGLLYKCTAAVSTAGAWNAANWTAVAVTDEMGGGGITGVKLNGTAITPDAQGAVDVLAVPWANANKNAVSIGANTTVADETLVVGSNNSASGGGSIAAGWNNSAGGNDSFAFGQDNRATGANSFAVGENCWARGKDSFAGGYMASTSKDQVGRWGTFVWNGGSTWYNTHGDGTFNVNAPGGTAGFWIGNQNLSQLLRYSLPAAISVSDATSTAALQDRAVNTVSVGAAVTTLNLTFPAAVAGYARDFFVRLDCAGTALATIALPSGETVDFGADALAGITGKSGVHLALFTEIAANHWLVSVREAEA